MPPKIGLTRGQVQAVEAAVAALYERVKARYLGPNTLQGWGDKRAYVKYVPDLTLQALYGTAAQEEHSRPHEETMDALARIASGYLDATEASTKAKVIGVVDRFLKDAEEQGIDTDLETVLTGHLNEVWGKATTDVKKILETEATHAANLGSIEGIGKVAAAMGVEDPVVAFLGPNDSDTCKECLRLFFLDDGVTPKVWKLSDVQHAHHKRGDENPKIGGCHPNCRHSPITVSRGFGFVGGSLTFIALDHDEYEHQNG